ncbi:hypothetical protein FOL47_004430, partial [Perkinsus chesapeaki]
ASDPYAANCGRELRHWRCHSDAQLLDVRRAYPSLKIREDLSWLGFGACCAPRLLKIVLDYILQPYSFTPSRRIPIDTLLKTVEDLSENPSSISASLLGSWLGKLVAHFPCAGYLRVCVAFAWSRPVSPDVLDYVKRLCSTIRQSGDPAHGL